MSLWTDRWLRERPLAQPAQGPGTDSIEVMPVVVLSQVFPARPSSIPDIRDFVRRCLAESPLTDEGNRQVGETVFRALLDAAGPTGSIQVAFRIFPEHVEVDVLHSDSQIQAGLLPNGANPATPTVRSGPARRCPEQREEQAGPGRALPRRVPKRVPKRAGPPGPRPPRPPRPSRWPSASPASRPRSRSGCPPRCGGRA